MKILVDGFSSQRGFWIETNNVRITSQFGHIKTPPLSTALRLCAFANIPVMIWLNLTLQKMINGLIGSYLPFYVKLFGEISLILFSCYFAVILVYRLFNKQLLSWHACEHKVINALEKGLSEITIADLKKTSTHCYTCSSNKQNGFMVATFLIGYSYPLYLAIKNRLELYLSSWSESLAMIILLALSAVFTLVALRFLQRALFMARPTEEQYQEAALVANRMIKKIKNQ